MKISVCIRQHSNQVLTKTVCGGSQGLWEGPFCKKQTFLKTSLSLCSLLPSPLLLRFLCLSILFAFHPPTPPLTSLPPRLPSSVSGKHWSPPPPICVQNKCVHMMQSPPSPLKWRLEWSPYLAVCASAVPPPPVCVCVCVCKSVCWLDLLTTQKST